MRVEIPHLVLMSYIQELDNVGGKYESVSAWTREAKFTIALANA